MSTPGAGPVFRPGVVTGPGAKSGPISDSVCDNAGQLNLQFFPLNVELGAGQAHANVLIRLQTPVRNLYITGAQGANFFPLLPRKFFIHFSQVAKDVSGGALGYTGLEPYFDLGYFGHFEACIPFQEFFWSNDDFGGVEHVTLLATDDVMLRFSRP